jgi:hypothetical protein
MNSPPTIRDDVTSAVNASNEHKTQIEAVKHIWNTLLAGARSQEELVVACTSLLDAGALLLLD